MEGPKILTAGKRVVADGGQGVENRQIPELSAGKGPVLDPPQGHGQNHLSAGPVFKGPRPDGDDLPPAQGLRHAHRLPGTQPGGDLYAVPLGLPAEVRLRGPGRPLGIENRAGLRLDSTSQSGPRTAPVRGGVPAHQGVPLPGEKSRPGGVPAAVGGDHRDLHDCAAGVVGIILQGNVALFGKNRHRLGVPHLFQPQLHRAPGLGNQLRPRPVRAGDGVALPGPEGKNQVLSRSAPAEIVAGGEALPLL